MNIQKPYPPYRAYYTVYTPAPDACVFCHYFDTKDEALDFFNSHANALSLTSTLHKYDAKNNAYIEQNGTERTLLEH